MTKRPTKPAKGVSDEKIKGYGIELGPGHMVKAFPLPHGDIALRWTTMQGAAELVTTVFLTEIAADATAHLIRKIIREAKR